MESNYVLVTGASGYIGSHCIVALVEAGLNVIAMKNSKSEENFAFKQIKKILGKEVETCCCNLLNIEEISNVFEKYKITTVIHLAATKGVSESMNFPIECYRNNLASTLNLLEVMRKFNVKKLIFSSSCAIYGDQREMPVKETAKPLQLSSVYGRSKYFIEEILRDTATADKEFEITILRYFNPVGSHDSGWLGEDPEKKQISFLTLLAKTAMDDAKNLSIFGSANIRDFIHVMDVAEAHIMAITKMNSFERFKIYNIGTGKGYSLLELVRKFEEVNSLQIQCTIKERRMGEIEAIIADTKLAEEELEWKCKRNIEQMCKDCWMWMKYYSENLK